MNTTYDRWVEWSGNDPAGLLAYISQPDETARLLGSRHIPQPGSSPPLERAEALYVRFTDRGIRYAYDKPGTRGHGFQVVRQPADVLAQARIGTCLDLAVVYSSACLAAGLHPLIIAVDPTSGSGPGHALVAVLTTSEWTPGGAGHAFDFDDATLARRRLSAQTSPFVPIDIALAARHGPTQPGTPALSFQEVIESARVYLSNEDDWLVRFILDVGQDWSSVPVRAQGVMLEAPYRDVPAEHGPIELLDGRYPLIDWQEREEQEALDEWARALLRDDEAIGVAVVHGVGGAGKTRLVAEVASRFGGDLWFAGGLPRPDRTGSVDLFGLKWLNDEPLPLFLVVDYAESYATDVLVKLFTLLSSRRDPTAVVLTARTVGGWWNDEGAGLAAALFKGGLNVAKQILPVRAAAPSRTNLFRAAAIKLGGNPDADVPDTETWTALELVMQAFLDSQGDGFAKTRPDLFEKILGHEIGYWGRVLLSVNAKPLDEVAWRMLGAAVQIAAPEKVSDLDRVIVAANISDDPERRQDLAAVLLKCLGDLSGGPAGSRELLQGLAIRPDRIGDFLAASAFAAKPERFVSLLTDMARRPSAVREDDNQVPKNPWFGAMSVLARAGHDQPDEVRSLVRSALASVSGLWGSALAVGANVGGPVLQETLAFLEAPNSPVSPEALAREIPLGTVSLRPLALTMARRAVEAPGSGGDEERAVRLGLLSIRLAEAGTQHRDEALSVVVEAVGIYRGLADGNPGALLPDLAGSLNNQATMLSALGRRDDARKIWRETIDTLPPHSASILRGDLVQSLLKDNDYDAAVTELGTAIASADSPGAVSHIVDRARQRARAILWTLAENDPSLHELGVPLWARTPIAETDIAFLNEWQEAAQTPGEEAAFVRRNHERLSQPALESVVESLRHLHTSNPSIGHFASVMAEIAQVGVEAVETRMRADGETLVAIREWISTPDWEESRRYLKGHVTTLLTNRARELLGDPRRAPVISQHAAILELSREAGFGPDRAYDLVQQPSDAIKACMTAIRDGDLSQLTLTVRCAPSALSLQPHGAFIAAFAYLAGQQFEAADDALTQAAALADQSDALASIGRLKDFQASQPSYAATMDRWIGMMKEAAARG